MKMMKIGEWKVGSEALTLLLMQVAFTFVFYLYLFTRRRVSERGDNRVENPKTHFLMFFFISSPRPYKT